jgi:hypothetical protein
VAIDPTVKRDITRSALRYRVDPRAALAIANVEGGVRRGAIGDHGTSFGPFQLHVGGALPRGRNAAWASSPMGIDYAVRSMARSGAAGLAGRSAVESISRRFERPADPNAEIRRAMAFYGGSAGALSQIANTGGGTSIASTGAGDRVNLASFLSGMLSSYAQTGQVSANPMQLLEASRTNTDPGPNGDGSASSASAPVFGGVGGSGTGKEQEMIQALNHARATGLRVGENTLFGGKVDPGVHVKGSFHYQYYGKPVGGRRVNRAADVSGSPQQMAAFYKWVRGHEPNPSELFYDPLGGIKYGKPIGAIGGHRDHVHVAF